VRFLCPYPSDMSLLYVERNITHDYYKGVVYICARGRHPLMCSWLLSLCFDSFSKLQFSCAAVGLSAIVPHCLLICPVAWRGDTHTHCCFTGDEGAGVALPSSSLLLFLGCLALWYDSRKMKVQLSTPFGAVNLF